MLDGALWYFRDKQDPTRAIGAIVGHVDDLLFTGNEEAKASLMDLGEELGYGSIEEEDFQWCGKRIRRCPETKEICISMVQYHENLKQVHVHQARRQDLESPLSPPERKQLKGILGSLQWLVAQLCFDQAFVVSSLQSEKPSVSTMLRANKAVEDFKKDKGFELRFRNVNFQNGGIVSVSDAALGNVHELGRVTPLPEEKVHSQSCYAVLLADENSVQGKAGNFNVLDFRSHRIARVCRSSYSAETGAEEGLDSAELVRGFIAAELRGVDGSRLIHFCGLPQCPWLE